MSVCCELGAIPVVEDSIACSKVAHATTPPDMNAYAACMIGRGYQQTGPNSFAKHTGIQPSTILKIGAVAAAAALVPGLLPAVIKGGTSVVGAIKSAAESSAEPTGPSAPYVPALPIPAPAAPASLASIVPGGGISPGILVLIGAGLLFALSRGR